jgi:hypothetical protein
MRWRMARVRVLLATRNEYVPAPGSSTRSESGIAASDFVPCPDCEGTGRTHRGRRPCLVCDGAGRRRRVGDEQPWDFYTGAPVVQHTPALRSMTQHELDVSIARIDALFAEREGVIDHERFGWERARQQRDRSGSYRKLERLLEQLRDVDERFVRVLSLVHDHGVRDPDGAEEAAVRWLAERMPRAIGVPDWVLEEEDAEVEREVLSHHGKGLRPSDIAELVGVSRHRVDRILSRAKVERAA